MGSAPESGLAPAPVHYQGQDLEALAAIPGYHGWVLDAFRGRLRGRVLEVGAGIGNLAKVYLPGVDEAVLVEPAPNLASRLRSGFQGDKVKVIASTLEASVERRDPAVGTAPFDACLLVNVLEHIEDDVGTLRCARGLLAAGGSLLVFVPALPRLYGSLDALVHHKRRYTKATLARAVESAGFRITTLRYFDVLGVVPWLLAGRVLKRKRFDRRAAEAYDRWVVPLGSRLESAWEPPLGKNLVCIAESPHGEGSRA